MALSCSVRIMYCVPQREYFTKPYTVINFVLTKVVMFGQDGWVPASLIFREFMNLHSVSVHIHTENEHGQLDVDLRVDQ